jgi:hypothetical protein
LLPVFLGIGTIVSFLAESCTFPIWFFGFLANVMANFISIPREMFTIKLLKALLKLPVAVFFMILSLLKIKGANKKFYHTPHG